MKKLYKKSLILFNLFALMLGLIMLFSAGFTQASAASDEPVYFKTWYQSIKDLMGGSGEYAAAAEAEGAVLLKNEEISAGKRALPLNKTEDKVSLFGVTAYDPIYCLSGAGRHEMNADIQQYFKSEFEKVGLTVNSDLASWYNTNTSYRRVKTTGNGQISQINGASWDDITTAEKTAAGYNTAVYVIGRMGNEDIDLPPYRTSGTAGLTDGDYLKLTAKEDNLLKGLKAAKDNGDFDRIIVLVNTAAPILDNFIDNAAYGIDAAMWIGFPGSAGIRAVAQLLVGTATPSGKLATMWYATRQDTPTYNYYGSFTNNSQTYVLYQEGMYAGYRYSETRYEDYVMGTPNAGTYNYSTSVRYPFGYGMSYADFSYEFVSLEADLSPEKNKDYKGELKPTGERRSAGDDYIATVKVTNTSSVFRGKEVVQIYLQQPYTETNKAHKVEKPAVELIGFAKTKKLAPGASEELKIKIDANKYFASYDIQANKYVLDIGTYHLTAAKDAHNAVNNILEAKEEADADKMTGTGDADLVKKVVIDETRSNAYKYWTQGGAEVTNLFDHADPNKTDPTSNVITFMARDNWAGTVSSTAQTVTHSTARLADKKTDSNGDFTNSKTNYPYYTDVDPTYGRVLDQHLDLADMVGVEYQDDHGATEESKQKWEDFIDQLTWNDMVLLLGQGRRSTAKIESINKPYTNDVNASNGVSWKFDMGLSDSGANRTAGFSARFDSSNRNYYPTGYPCEGIIASSFNINVALAVGQSIGEDALWSGASGLYGFGLNLHRSPYQGRAGEYYSEDSYLTGIIAGWSSKGAWSKGLYVYNKHFVLNDQDTNRSAHATWITEQAMRQIYLRPFEIAIEIGDAMNVMSSFNRIGSCQSSNDYNLMTKCLRGEFGMRGFAVTDWFSSTGMGPANGVLAGNDLPDGDGRSAFNNRGPGTGNGHLGQAMRVSARRILYTIANSNAMNFYIPTATAPASTDNQDTGWTVNDGMFIAIIIVCVVSAAFFVGIPTLQVIKKNKAKKTKQKF